MFFFMTAYTNNLPFIFCILFCFSAAGSTATLPPPSFTPITTPGTTPSTTPFSPGFGTGTGTGTSTPGFGGFSPPDYNSAIMTPSYTSLFLSLLLGTCLCFQLMSF